MTPLQTAAQSALDMLLDLQCGHWSPSECDRVRVMLELALKDVDHESDQVLGAYMTGVREGRRQANKEDRSVSS